MSPLGNYWSTFLFIFSLSEQTQLSFTPKYYYIYCLLTNVLHFLHCSSIVVLSMMTAPKLLAIILVALYLQFYHTKVLLVQTHDGSDNAPKESIKSRVPSQIKTKTSKLKTKSGQHRIQNKALGLPADLLPGPDEKPGRQII